MQQKCFISLTRGFDNSLPQLQGLRTDKRAADAGGGSVMLQQSTCQHVGALVVSNGPSLM